MKDCLGPVFQYAYDVYGKLLTETDGAKVIQQENRYFPDGKLLQSRQADGQEIQYRYTVQGMETQVSTSRSRQENKPAQQYSYDSRGRITGVQDGNEHQTHYAMAMDSWGRIRKVHNADGGAEGYTYDFAGNITSTQDANGGVRRDVLYL